MWGGVQLVLEMGPRIGIPVLLLSGEMGSVTGSCVTATHMPPSSLLQVTPPVKINPSLVGQPTAWSFMPREKVVLSWIPALPSQDS